MRQRFFDCAAASFYNSGVFDTIEIAAPLNEQIFRNCPVCGSHESEPYLEKHGLKIVRCAQCSMLFANPVSAEFATGHYYDSTGAEYYLSPEKLQSDYASVRFQRELKLFRRHCQSGAVLDVGCSSGAFLYQLNIASPARMKLSELMSAARRSITPNQKAFPVLRGDFLAHDLRAKRNSMP